MASQGSQQLGVAVAAEGQSSQRSGDSEWVERAGYSEGVEAEGLQQATFGKVRRTKQSSIDTHSFTSLSIVGQIPPPTVTRTVSGGQFDVSGLESGMCQLCLLRLQAAPRGADCG